MSALSSVASYFIHADVRNFDDGIAHFRPGTGPPIVFTNLSFHAPTGADVLAAATARYHAIIRRNRRNRRNHRPATATKNVAYSVAFKVSDLDAPLSPGATDESYEIAADAAGATITAPTQWGALAALETFSQLLYARGDGQHSLPAAPIKVRDSPRFGYRGLMIDTSRSYLTVTAIKQGLDAMAYCKLNVLHWHMVDDQSFPVVSTRSQSWQGSAPTPPHTSTPTPT